MSIARKLRASLTRAGSTLKAIRKRVGCRRRAMLTGAILSGGIWTSSFATVSAEVVELATTPIGISSADAGTVRRVTQNQRLEADAQRSDAPRSAAPRSTVPPTPVRPGTAAAPTFQPPTPPPENGPGLQESNQVDELNVDPNASIEELTPPPPPPLSSVAAPPAFPTTASQASLGITLGGLSAAPFMMGDFFGGGLANLSGSQTVRSNFHASSLILSGGPGSASSLLAFEVGTDPVANDVFTTGVGLDLAGASDGADTFNLAEPLPPSNAPTSPGPGFVFDGGTAVYTNGTGATTAQPGIYDDGDIWFLDYSYTQTIGLNPNTGEPVRPVPSPGVAARRVKIAENFSPEVRDRAFFNYSFFNDAFGGLGDVSRYILGFEKILVPELVSLEARLPLAGTYASSQAFDAASTRDFEVGNAALILKGVLLRSDRMIWSGGLGVAVPIANDTVISNGGQNIVVIENESVHLLPFMALLLRQSRDTVFQSYAQIDVATNGDPIFANLTGGPLPRIGKFNDSTLLHLDAAFNHVLYRNRRSSHLREVIGNAELHYTATLQDSDFISSGGLTYTNLKRNFNILNATVGTHLVMGDHWVISPGMSVPLRDGLDEQFDYEAILQVNYLR